MKKVNIYYFNKTRNDGTAFYSWLAMKKLSEGRTTAIDNGMPTFQLEFLLPPDDKFAPANSAKPADFHFYVDWGEDCFGGCDYVPPSPNAVWWIDSHLGKEYRLERSKKFDKVYLAQLNDVQYFRDNGCKDVEWLPLAAEPDLWKPMAVAKKYDVSFIGFLNCEKRIEYLELLFKSQPNFFYGVKFFEKAVQKFNESRVLFNISIKDDVNMRMFEAIATGVPVLNNKISNNGQEVLFEEGKHFVGYEDKAEMIKQANKMLENNAWAKELGEAGKNHVIKNHCYEHRMQKVLQKGGIL